MSQFFRFLPPGDSSAPKSLKTNHMSEQETGDEQFLPSSGTRPSNPSKPYMSEQETGEMSSSFVRSCFRSFLRDSALQSLKSSNPSNVYVIRGVSARAHPPTYTVHRWTDSDRGWVRTYEGDWSVKSGMSNAVFLHAYEGEVMTSVRTMTPLWALSISCT